MATKQVPVPKDDKAELRAKQEALKTAIANIEKRSGKGSVFRVGDKPRTRIPSISTGIVSLDLAIGIGGLPRGRVIEILGPEGSGKTSAALSVIAEAQKLGGTAAFLDAENSLDLEYAKALGVDVDNLYLQQPNFGEEALQTAEELANSGSVDVIVIDSVSALIPRVEYEGELGDPSMGLQARMMSQALRKLSGVVAKSNTMLIFINQIRFRIGIKFGNPETSSGGNALKFYASVRLDVRRIESIKEGDVVTGTRVRIKVVKNKVAAPYKQAEVDFMFGKGINKYKDVLELATDRNLIQKSGSWYSYKEERIGQGADAAAQYLKKDSVLYQDLRMQLLKPVEDVPLAVEIPEEIVDADQV